MFSRMIVALVALWAGACESPPGKFHGSREEFFATTKSLLVQSLEGPQFDPDQLAEIDRRVLEKLNDYGFRTVDGSLIKGGDAAAEGVDAVLFKGLVVRNAIFDRFGARWDGIECDFELPSSGPRGLSDDLAGKVKGMSLYISIADGEGNLRYEGFGGLGLLHRWNGNRYEPVDPKTLLSDPAVIERAVRITLEPLEH